MRLVQWALRSSVPVALGLLALPGPAASALVPVPAVEAEAMALPGSAGQPFADASASGQAGLLVWTNGTATATLSTRRTRTALVVRARGDQCQGAPQLQVALDGVVVATVPVPATAWTDYTVAGSWPAGRHRVALSFTNDAATPDCDRNLRLDRLRLGAAPPPPVAGNPFTGAQPYQDPESPAAREAAARRSWDPAGATALDKIAQGSAADWLGDWNATGSLAAYVHGRVATERAAGALPVLVAYDVPHRDCGSYSAGGAPDAAAYRQWVGQLALGIGAEKAVVVLEPDALAGMDCLSPADQAERTGLLAEAVATLSTLPATSVYLDAGGATWQPAAVMAPRLLAAGVGSARGFSLDVSGFVANEVELPYGDTLSALVGGKHFLVDSSRNGLGQGDTWCNPAGRALGARMTTATGDPLADAFTWVKAPGESDGTCGGGPPAGQFWPDYAIGLAQRAAY